MMLQDSQFFTFIYKELYAELGGFVLCDPQRIDQFHGGKAHHLNLLQRYTETEEGDQVCNQGIAIPVTDIEPWWYTLVIRHVAMPTYLTGTLRVVSRGFILGTETGQLCLCGLGYLGDWNPVNNPSCYVPVTIFPGWYEVEIRGGLQGEVADREELVYEFVFTPSAQPPVFIADLSINMNLVDET